MGRFMLLAARRSGSSFLISTLNSHPQIQAYKSPFHRKRPLKYLPYFEKPGTPFFEYRSASIKRQIDYIFRRKHLINAFLTEFYAADHGSKAVVVRIVYPHEYPEVLEWALENQVGVLHLIRENFLNSVVYYATSKREPSVRLSPEILKRRLIERTRQVETYRAMFENGRYYPISDESFMANQQDEARRLLDFLGVDPSIPLTFGPREPNPELADILENYEEIAQAFKGSVFERYLETTQANQVEAGPVTSGLDKD